MELRSSLAHLEQGLHITQAPELASAVHWTPSQEEPLHRWFRYREGFSPSLFKYFSSSTKNFETRLDPFCGCGTTMVESAKQGIKSYGLDVNPLATFIADVKTRSYSCEFADQFLVVAQDIFNAYASSEPVPVAPYELLKKLFLPKSLDILLRIQRLIFAAPLGSLRDLLFLAWLSILEDASNVFKEGNGLKYRNKRRRPGEYETLPDEIWIPRYFGADIRKFVEQLWLEKCQQIADDIRAVQIPEGQVTIREGSALEASALEFAGNVDLAVFSPPYVNRFDYFESFKMELWMGGFVSRPGDLTSLRDASMRSHLSAGRSRPREEWAELEPFLIAMDPEASSVRMGIKDTARGYFADFRALLRSLNAVVREGGKVVIVVGNSAYAQSIIPTDLLVARLGLEEGFAVESVLVARPLHVSSQQRFALKHVEDHMRESVIVMRR